MLGHWDDVVDVLGLQSDGFSGYDGTGMVLRVPEAVKRQVDTLSGKACPGESCMSALGHPGITMGVKKSWLES